MTNNKIKMAQKHTTTPLEDFVRAAQEKDMAGLIAAVMAMNDNDFNDVYPKLTENLNKVYGSREYQNGIAAQLMYMTPFDYEKEMEGYQGFLKLLEELDTTPEKKNFLKLLVDKSYDAMLKYEKDPSEHIRVVIKKLNEDAIIPSYAHTGDAGADLYALEDTTAMAGGVTFVHTGIAMKIPKGYEGQIRPRSGMSAKTKIRVANTPGTIDCNYRGEVQILVDNYGNAPYIIKKGDRIAQIVFNKVPTADFEEGEVETENDNTRGEKGFGSSGTAEKVDG